METASVSYVRGRSGRSLIIAVKMVGHGALNGLDGLFSMRQDGQFLRTLNQGSPAGEGYRAIAADYEPTDQGLRALLTGKLADAVLMPALL